MVNGTNKFLEAAAEVFYKKNHSSKFWHIHRKTPVLESLFIQVVALQSCNFIKKRP